VKRFIACAVIAGSLVACASPKREPATAVVDVTVSQGGNSAVVAAEIAATRDRRERGLMGVSAMRRSRGMLFLFPSAVRGGFWMKDTLIPLDIAFISGGVVQEVRSMTPCRVADCPLTTPARPYEMALEVNAGFFGAHRLGAGATVTVSGGLPRAS